MFGGILGGGTFNGVTPKDGLNERVPIPEGGITPSGTGGATPK